MDIRRNIILSETMPHFVQAVSEIDQCLQIFRQVDLLDFGQAVSEIDQCLKIFRQVPLYRSTSAIISFLHQRVMSSSSDATSFQKAVSEID
jgi:hypothetical protein